MWKGIDVSDNQGTIDWPQVKAAGVEFAILRSVRRSGKADGQFAANLAGCREHGIPVSVYKYTYAASPGAAALEARQVVDLLRASGMTGTTVWWDVEDKSLRPLGSAMLTACIKAVQDVVEAAGYKFGLYTGFYVYNERWFDFGAFTAVPLWVARYYAGYNAMDFKAMPREDKEPDVGRDLWGWQYTSTGRVRGINGNVDLDICYVDPAGEQPAPAEEYYPLPHISAVFEVCGIPSSYAERKRIAVVNGLPNYSGTVEENMILIGLLAQGKLKKV